MNDTPEQILVDEWIRQADRAKSMTGMDAIWFPDAEETLAALRAHGLLSEGAPTEDDREALVRVVANHPIAPLMRLGGDAGYPLADAILAAGFSRAAVPDAALAAIERVRAEADAYAEQSDVMEPCGAVAQALRTALDGAPEPGWEEHINYGAERTDGSVAYEPRGRNYATHQRVARFGPWLPVGGEQP